MSVWTDAPVSRRLVRGSSRIVLAISMLLLATGLAWGAEEDESGWSLDDLERHLVLDWDAPAECPSDRAVRDRIRTLLKTKGEAEHQVVAKATVTRTPAGYALELAFDDGPKRQLTSDNCIGLVEATSIIIALDIETHVKPAPSIAESTPTPHRPRAARSTRPSTRLPSSAASPLRLAVGAMTLGDVGSLPEPTAGYRATFALSYRAVRAEAAATVFASRDAEGLREGTGVRVDLRTGGLQLCHSWSLDRSAALGTCLGSEAGSSTVTGFGITRPSTSTGLWMSVLASSQLRLRSVRPLVFGLEVGAVTSRAQAIIRGQGTVFDPAPWLARATVGLEFEILPRARME
ncbi:MAG: hypothetical protein BGO98_21850 [Myxococcales bacterium 68-20]|nr:MAG: hypothetical protein BGO98_21850 [Myxococcales bacterium 68-20]